MSFFLGQMIFKIIFRFWFTEILYDTEILWSEILYAHLFRVKIDGEHLRCSNLERDRSKNFWTETPFNLNGLNGLNGNWNWERTIMKLGESTKSRSLIIISTIFSAYDVIITGYENRKKLKFTVKLLPICLINTKSTTEFIFDGFRALWRHHKKLRNFVKSTF